MNFANNTMGKNVLLAKRNKPLENALWQAHLFVALRFVIHVSVDVCVNISFELESRREII